MKPWTSRPILIASIGFIFVIAGTIFSFVWPVLFNHILSKELPVRPNSRVFDLWKTTGTDDMPLHMEFYFFNWTNPEELKIPGKKPNLVEVGPYTFEHRAEKINITFNPENSTVSYLVRKYWTFDQSRSIGSLNDTLIQLNVLAVAAAYKVRYWSKFMQDSLSLVLGKLSSIHVVRTIDELMFTGYEDDLITLGRMAVDDDDTPPFDRFGWFYLRNGTTFFDGHYNMATGEDDIGNLGILKMWNHKDTTRYYKSPCNVVEGSAGEFFPPNRDQTEISLFSADICRPVTYEYTETVTHHGISGYKYELGQKTLSNNTRRQYPHDTAKYFERTTTTEDFFSAEHSTQRTIHDNIDPDTVNMGHCYCNGECSPMGVINITACRYGAPGFVSLPHFHKADPILKEKVHGMHPDESRHSFYMLLEPTTGIPIDVAARLQINILLQPWPTISLFQDVPKIYFPCFWFSMRAGVTEDLAASLRGLLWVPSIGLYSSIILAIIGGLLLIAIAFSQFVLAGRSRSRNVRPRKIGVSDKSKKTELVYMDTTTGPDDNERTDRQLYPKN